MKSKTKSTIVIIGTLIIGIIMGLLISAGFVNKRIRSFKRLATPEGFRNRLNEIVQPDSIQAVKLDKLMIEFRKRFDELHANMKNQLDTMHAELSKILNPEQVKRLEKEMFKRRFRPFEHNRKNSFRQRQMKNHQRDSSNRDSKEEQNK